MNKQILTVMFKEIKDNLRDKKTVMSSIFMGAVFGPILLVVMMNAVSGMMKDKAEKQLELHVNGINNAKSFITFVKSQGAKVSSFSGDAKKAILDKDKEAILVIPSNFAEKFESGIPAEIQLYYDATAKGATNITQKRIKSLIKSYSRSIGMIRLQLRGISPSLLQAVTIEDHDVSTAESKGAKALAFLPYFLIMGLFMGSMYLAIDTMAGEKERNSLESLLLNPIKRSYLLTGKLLATISFGIITLFATLLTFKFALPFMPLDTMGISFNFGIKNITLFAILLAPLSVMAASLQTIIATFSKSFKEAQTYVSLLIFIPMIPSIILMMVPVKEKLWMMFVPILGQNLAINQILRGEPVSLLWFIAVAVGSLFVGLLLALLAIKLYNRESLLFSD